MRPALIALALLASCTIHHPSSDGRFAPCHIITAEGVTEHLDAYTARCGR